MITIRDTLESNGRTLIWSEITSPPLKMMDGRMTAIETTHEFSGGAYGTHTIIGGDHRARVHWEGYRAVNAQAPRKGALDPPGSA